MIGIAQLLAEHRQLEERAERLTRIAGLAVPDPAAVAGERWQMAKMLRDHGAHADRLVCDPMLASGNLEIMVIAAESRRGYDALGAAFDHYIADWPVSRIANEWIAFRLATARIVDALLAQMTSEEQTLYPSLDRALTRHAA